MIKHIRKFFTEYLDLDVSKEKNWEIWVVVGILTFMILLLIIFN